MERLPWRLLFCLVLAKIGHPREGGYGKKHKSFEPQMFMTMVGHPLS